MDKQDIDLERVEARLRQFLNRPVELAGAAAGCALLAGAMPYAHRVQSYNTSMSRYGFDGFSVIGFLLYLTILAYALAFLSRKRPRLGLPRRTCDLASFWLTLFTMVRTYVFLEQYEVSQTTFLFFFSSSSTSFSPAIGVVFLAAAPVLLWRARMVEKRSGGGGSIVAVSGTGDP